MAVPSATTTPTLPASNSTADQAGSTPPVKSVTVPGGAAPGDKFVSSENDTGKDEEAKGAISTAKGILSRIHLLITSTVKILNPVARFAIFGTVVGLCREGVDLLQGLLGSGDFKNSSLKGNLTGLLSLLNLTNGTSKDSAGFWKDGIKENRDLTKMWDDQSKMVG